MNQLTINPEFQNLIPSPSNEELKQLEKNLLSNGCFTPLIIWGETIIDGHNRYEICTKLNIPFLTITKEFKSINEAKIWIILNQFGRRNLDLLDRARLAIELKDLNKLVSGTRTDLTFALNQAKVNTTQEIANLSGISRSTISMVENIDKKASEEIKSKLNNGDISINAAYKTLTTNPSTADLFDDVDLKPNWSETIGQNVKNFINSEEGLNADIPKRIYNKTEWTLEPTLLKWDIINQIMDEQSSKIGGHSSVVSLINYLLAKELKNYEKGITL